jgi:hypothetical protein
MFSSPIVYAWIAWLLVVGVIAVLRSQHISARNAGEPNVARSVGLVR